MKRGRGQPTSAAPRVATREKIIIAAERLFAQKGLAVSLREIAAASGQRNPAAVSYHFGSKDGLVQAIVDYRRRPINERRLALLEEFGRRGRTEDMRCLIEASVYPLLELIKPGSAYARFVAAVWEQRGQTLARLTSEDEGSRRVLDGIYALMKGVPELLRSSRMLMVTKLLFRTLADYEGELEHDEGPPIPAAVLGPELVNIIVALHSAPVSASAQRILGATPPHRQRSDP